MTTATGSNGFSRSLARRKDRSLLVMDIAGWGSQTQGGDEALQLGRWAKQAELQLLPAHNGRIIRRLSHGLVMEFADARNCLQAAFALGRQADATGRRPDGPHLRWRAAAHRTDGSQGHDGIAERDVNLMSSLAALAQPGQVVVTAELRDRLINGLDADFEDLGYQRVKPWAQPVRLFRAHPDAADAADKATAAQRDRRPGLAIMPFRGGSAEANHRVVGELIAEGVIARLSHSIGLRVISCQSTSALRDCGSLSDIEQLLGATFVLSGSYSIRGKDLLIEAELSEAHGHTLLWSGQMPHPVDDLLQDQSELLHALASTVARELRGVRLRRVLGRPLPRIDSNLLLDTGISMTHSDSAKTYARGREVFAELAARHPGLALPRAWLGMWHVLNIVKGQSADIGSDTALAREQTLRALDAEPGNAMALAVEGYIQCQLLGNPEQAHKHLNAAIEANPSEPMAWLFKSLFSSMWGSTSASVTEAYIARALSPVDPLRYFFDLLTGGALCADDRHEQAVIYAQRSLRADRHHVPTLRLLLTAQAELGRIEDGKQTLDRLLAVAPRLTVSSYLSMGSTDSPMRQRCAKAMRLLGLPEN